MALTQNIPFRVPVPSGVPDNFTSPEVMAAVEMQLAGDRSILRGMDQVTGMAPKDTSLWSTIKPNDTILVQNHRRFYCKAFVPITVARLVNFFLSGGIVQARLADASPGLLHKARGYATRTYAAGEFGEFIVGSGLISGFPGLVINQDLWLGAAGAYLIAAPAVVGSLVQPVGFGLDTEVAFIDISQFTTIV